MGLRLAGEVMVLSQKLLGQGCAVGVESLRCMGQVYLATI